MSASQMLCHDCDAFQGLPPSVGPHPCHRLELTCQHDCHLWWKSSSSLSLTAWPEAVIIIIIVGSDAMGRYFHLDVYQISQLYHRNVSEQYRYHCFSTRTVHQFAIYCIWKWHLTFQVPVKCFPCFVHTWWQHDDASLHWGWNIVMLYVQYTMSMH